MSDDKYLDGDGLTRILQKVNNAHAKKGEDLTTTQINQANKVVQTNTTGNADYRVLLSNNANDTTETAGTRKSNKIQGNPSTGIITANDFKINGGKSLSLIQNIVFNPKTMGLSTLASIISLIKNDTISANDVFSIGDYTDDIISITGNDSGSANSSNTVSGRLMYVDGPGTTDGGTSYKAMFAILTKPSMFMKTYNSGSTTTRCPYEITQSSNKYPRITDTNISVLQPINVKLKYLGGMYGITDSTYTTNNYIFLPGGTLSSETTYDNKYRPYDKLRWDTKKLYDAYVASGLHYYDFIGGTNSPYSDYAKNVLTRNGYVTTNATNVYVFYDRIDIINPPMVVKTTHQANQYSSTSYINPSILMFCV